METVLITGGSGLVGTRLTEMLIAKNYSVIIVGRNANVLSTNPQIRYAKWNLAEQTIDSDAIAKADFIINLAGAGVADKRWSKERKEEIVQSRVQGGNLLVKALQQNVNTVKAVISASAVGWYGPDVEEKIKFEEDSVASNDYLGSTCQLWEQSIEPVAQKARLVKLRIGIVLTTKGAALKEFLNPIKIGIAAILGNGKQMISWIHIDDLCNQFIYAIENNNLSGVYNAVAPNPVSNKQLTLEAAKQVKVNFFIPIYVPSFVLKIMLGEMSVEVLKSCTVSSKKIQQAGFKFSFSTIGEALNDLLKK